MRPGTRELKEITLLNGETFVAKGQEFFALDDHWVFWYDEKAVVKMAIPATSVGYLYNEMYCKKAV